MPHDQSTRPPHVCILTTAHPIDDVRVNEKFAQSFVRRGFRVSWVGPGHAFFDSSVGRDPGISFHLVPPYKRLIERVLARGRIRRMAEQVPEVDCYYTPDPDSVRIAFRLAKRNRAKVIFDIHENYHGPLLTRWLGPLAIGPVREALRRELVGTCRRCDLVLGVNATILELYDARSSGLVVRSCAPRWFAEQPAAEVFAEGRTEFRFLHGKSNLGRGTLKVVEALGLAAREEPDIRGVMFGTADQSDPEFVRLMEAANRLGAAEALELRRPVPLRQMPAEMAKCVVGLIAYGREMGRDCLPNRLFEYMAAGLAVIVPTYAPEMVAIVEREECGRVVDFEDPVAIAATMLELRRNPDACRAMGHRAREAFLVRHNWTEEVQPVLDYISGNALGGRWP